jgi:hypothetical protein
MSDSKKDSLEKIEQSNAWSKKLKIKVPAISDDLLKNCKKDPKSENWIKDTIKEVKNNEPQKVLYEPLSDTQYKQINKMPPVIGTYTAYEQDGSRGFAPIVSDSIPGNSANLSTFGNSANITKNVIQETSLEQLNLVSLQSSILGNVNSYQNALLHNLTDHIDKSITKQMKKMNFANNSSYKEEKKHSNRCYTCKPRGKVKKHVIGKSPCGNFVFHHDMNHRPVILMTPVKHLKNIDEFDISLLKPMFESINSFCNFWNIKDYQISYNCGNWQVHEHFHIKIKITDKISNRMRGDHFRLQKLNSNFKSKEIDKEK